jgi:subtilisin
VKHVPLLATLAASLCGALLPAATAAADPTKPYIVLFEKSSAPGARAATADLAADEHFTPTQRYDDAVHGFAARLDAHDVDAVRDDPRVKAVVADRPVKITTDVPLAAGDNTPLGVRRVGAGTATTAREASTANVAVIDTGVDLGHPDLNAVAGTNCNGTGAPTDGNGHGTHVAGIIGARNQGSGAVGVAPDTKIFAVRVLSAGGSGYTSNIVCGIDWVTSTRTDSDPTNDIRVANMSLGGGMAPYGNCGRSVNDVEHIAICNSVAAGVTYVVAAGNSSTDYQNFAPANYGEVLTVTAVSDSNGLPGGTGGADGCFGNADDTPATYSNYATRAADIAHTIAAPGTCIRSTYPGGRYANMSGTSMASPHVAGLVALCMGENGAHGPCWDKSPADVVSIMLDAAGTTAAQAPADAFTGSPSKASGGKTYGDMASPAWPSAARLVPAVTAYPTISGTAQTGATLTVDKGTWTGTGNTYAYQWLRCASTAVSSCASIAGATAATYVPVSGDVGKILRTRVTASNGEGAAMTRSYGTAAITAPVLVAPSNTAYPAITGTAAVGATLTGTNGTWKGTTPITYALQWLRCGDASIASCAAISGARSLSYTLVTADRGKLIRLSVTASNAKGSASMRSYATASVTGPPPPANTSYPSINGATAASSTTAGTTLTASLGSWSGSPTSYAYQWLRCGDASIASCASVTGATSSTYTPSAADRGKLFRISVTATNANGSATMRSYAMTIR